MVERTVATRRACAPTMSCPVTTPEELVTFKREETERARRGHRGVPRLVVKQRHLSEVIARTAVDDESSFSRDRGAASLDDVEPISSFSLTEHRRTRGHVDRYEVPRESLEGRRRERGEQVRRAEHGHLSGRHTKAPTSSVESRRRTAKPAMGRNAPAARSVHLAPTQTTMSDPTNAPTPSIAM